MVTKLHNLKIPCLALPCPALPRTLPDSFMSEADRTPDIVTGFSLGESSLQTHYCISNVTILCS